MDHFPEDDDFEGWGAEGREESFLEYAIRRRTALLMNRLARNIHTTKDDKAISIRAMETSHLRNSINYGKLHPHPYWEKAIPRFEAELKRREEADAAPRNS